MGRISVLVKEAMLLLVSKLELPDGWKIRIPNKKMLKIPGERGESK